ncbi:MAG: GNAT family N-acetyltransferase, partial [Actinomyces sp.]
FADKPEWAMCYCRFPHVPAERWGDRTWYHNRAELADGLGSGEMRAYVARAEGRIVGWLNASDRARSIHARGDDAGVASTLCFTVAVPWRGRGIARRLLEFAVDDLAADPAVRLVEGYARPDPPDPATAFPGPLELYLSCGFTATDETVADGRLVVVRRPAE